MSINRQETAAIPIKCECGKTLGFLENGILKVKCRNCKRVKAIKVKVVNTDR